MSPVFRPFHGATVPCSMFLFLFLQFQVIFLIFLKPFFVSWDFDIHTRILLYVQYLARCRDSNPRCCNCSLVCHQWATHTLSLSFFTIFLNIWYYYCRINHHFGQNWFILKVGKTHIGDHLFPPWTQLILKGFSNVALHYEIFPGVGIHKCYPFLPSSFTVHCKNQGKYRTALVNTSKDFSNIF